MAFHQHEYHGFLLDHHVRRTQKDIQEQFALLLRIQEETPALRHDLYRRSHKLRKQQKQLIHLEQYNYSSILLFSVTSVLLDRMIQSLVSETLVYLTSRRKDTYGMEQQEHTDECMQPASNNQL